MDNFVENSSTQCLENDEAQFLLPVSKQLPPQPTNKPPPVPPKPKKSLIHVHLTPTSSTSSMTITEEEHSDNSSSDLCNLGLPATTRSRSSTPSSLSSSQSSYNLGQPPCAKNVPKSETSSCLQGMSPSGQNLLESKNLARLEITDPEVVIREFGDCSQNCGPLTPPLANLDGEEEGTIEVPINHGGESVTAGPCQIIPGEPDAATFQCPFSRFHTRNTNISEFLKFSPNNSNNSGLEVTRLKFLLQDVKDGEAGILSSAFLEKLIRMLVTSSPDNDMRRSFCKQDFFEFCRRFVEEKRCSMIFRYYCLFYNVMSCRIIPLGEIAKTNIMERFQQDFELAAANTCRCGHSGSNNKAKSYDDEEKDDNVRHDSSENSELEHAAFSPTVRMVLASILLIPLYNKIANSSDHQQRPHLDYETEKRFATTIMRLICDVESVHIFHDNHHLGDTRNNNNNEVTLSNSKEILTNLLISQNLCFQDNNNNPFLSALSEFGWDKSQLKEKLKIIFLRESYAYGKGYEKGIISFLSTLKVPLHTPLGLQLAGLEGLLKLFCDTLSLNDDNAAFLNGDDLSIIIATTEASNQTGNQNDNIKAFIKKLKNKHDYYLLLNQKIRQTPAAAVEEEVELDFAQSNADINMTLLANSRFITTTTSPRSSRRPPLPHPEEVKRSILSKSKVMLWPIERMLKWLGCSKRMSSSTVCPASVRDVEYLRDTEVGGGGDKLPLSLIR